MMLLNAALHGNYQGKQVEENFTKSDLPISSGILCISISQQQTLHLKSIFSVGKCRLSFWDDHCLHE